MNVRTTIETPSTLQSLYIYFGERNGAQCPLLVESLDQRLDRFNRIHFRMTISDGQPPHSLSAVSATLPSKKENWIRMNEGREREREREKVGEPKKKTIEKRKNWESVNAIHTHRHIRNVCFTGYIGSIASLWERLFFGSREKIVRWTMINVNKTKNNAHAVQNCIGSARFAIHRIRCIIY